MITYFVRELVKEMEVASDRTRVGLLTFSDTATQVMNLNSYPQKEDVMQVQ